MKTRTIRLKKVAALIGFSHSSTYKHIIKDTDNNTLLGYDTEAEL